MPARKKKTELSRYTSTENWRHISAYVPHEIYDAIERRAKESRRSISAQVVVMLEGAAKTA